jgi:hypothetical protein
LILDACQRLDLASQLALKVFDAAESDEIGNGVESLSFSVDIDKLPDLVLL